MLCVVAASLAVPPSTFNGAQWISPNGAVPNGTFVAYRSELELSTVPLACNSSISLAVDTKYWLYVNGRMVVWEGGLKRGPSPGAGYYDTLDLSTAPWVAGTFAFKLKKSKLNMAFSQGTNIFAVFSLYLGRRTVPPTQPWY